MFNFPGLPPMPQILTSTEAARLCGVSFRTVIRWIERGELRAYRLPGRGDYRVQFGELRRFMGEHDMPLPVETGGGVRRVLVVDDDPGMLAALNRVLQLDGFETALAADGFGAGALLHQFKPGLMTLDLAMPGMDGLAVLLFLKERPPPFDFKVLVISGDSEERLRQALALGAHGVLRKPFDNAELLAAVHRLVGGAGKER
jgi:excisionase family DNA binding protein